MIVLIVFFSSGLGHATEPRMQNGMPIGRYVVTAPQRQIHVAAVLASCVFDAISSQ